MKSAGPLVVPSGCLWARAVLHPPPIGISCFSSFFSRRARFCGPMAMLRNGLLRYILYTCPNLWCNSCLKCYGMDCFSTYLTHVQTCDVTCVSSATEWTALVHTVHMSKPVMQLCVKCYGMDCFGTYFTHVQTCDVTCVSSATEWTASVHTVHMPKPVM